MGNNPGKPDRPIFRHMCFHVIQTNPEFRVAHLLGCSRTRNGYAGPPARTKEVSTGLEQAESRMIWSHGIDIEYA